MRYNYKQLLSLAFILYSFILIKKKNKIKGMFPLHLLHASRYFTDRGDRGTPLNYHIQFGMHE